jgi:hypothetical protein
MSSGQRCVDETIEPFSIETLSSGRPWLDQIAIVASSASLCRRGGVAGVKIGWVVTRNWQSHSH